MHKPHTMPSTEAPTMDNGSLLFEGVSFSIMVVLFFIIVFLVFKLIKKYRENGYCIKVKSVETTRRQESIYNRSTAIAAIETPPDYQTATDMPSEGSNHDIIVNQTIASMENSRPTTPDVPPPSYAIVMRNRLSKHLRWFTQSFKRKSQDNGTQPPELSISSMTEEHV